MVIPLDLLAQWHILAANLPLRSPIHATDVFAFDVLGESDEACLSNMGFGADFQLDVQQNQQGGQSEVGTVRETELWAIVRLPNGDALTSRGTV